MSGCLSTNGVRTRLFGCVSKLIQTSRKLNFHSSARTSLPPVQSKACLKRSDSGRGGNWTRRQSFDKGANLQRTKSGHSLLRLRQWIAHEIEDGGGHGGETGFEGRF